MCFSTYQRRYQSYQNIIFNCPAQIKPELLAAAGLYFHGKYEFTFYPNWHLFTGKFGRYLDAVQCYSCKKALFDWQPTDDPWLEHERVSHQCRFLTEKKNQEFYESLKRHLTSSNESSHSDCERMLCKICLTGEMNILLLPCAHLVSCEYCSLNFANCPLCRRQIDSTLKIFIG